MEQQTMKQSKHLVLCASIYAAMFCGALLCVIPQHASANEDLCPDVDAAKQNAPHNSDGMQASIDLLNLCVERARLLKQLDDLAVQRDEALNKVTHGGSGGAMGVNAMGGVSGIPPLSSAVLPSLPTDVTGLKPGDVRVTGTAGNPLSGVPNITAEAPRQKASWKVRKIWGQGSSMRAQLTDGSGTLLNVVRGDVMPDDAVVEAVSVKGVSVSRKGKVIDLSWDAAANSAASD